jgi:hypothetical protein
LGTGEVVGFDGRYVTVYFPLSDENKDFLAQADVLKIVEAPPKRKTAAKSSNSQNSNPISTNRLDNRVQRDQENAQAACRIAKDGMREFVSFKQMPDIQGSSKNTRKKEEEDQRRHKDLVAISQVPFHVMAEVEMETLINGKIQHQKNLLYAHVDTRTNNPLNSEGHRINILSWTHPAIQTALSSDLREVTDLKAHGYSLRSVTPIARAKFSQVVPDVAGLYEPGGLVGRKKEARHVTGLKAVKLDMTKSQVDAFLSKMSGMMLVSGAPGSGKTTVAMQRIRFLFDQQDECATQPGNVRYDADLTKIFLANENLIAYSKDMLEKGLQIPASVVEPVDAFLERYLQDIWTFKQQANLRRRKLFHLEERARQAFFGLCSVGDLRNCWRKYEEQIAERLCMAEESLWQEVARRNNKALYASSLISALTASAKARLGNDPLSSKVTMSAIYRAVGDKYERLRNSVQEEGEIERFDAEFQKWLFWVYDPFDAMVAYFSEEMYEGGVRIKKGMASKIEKDEVLRAIREDWANRNYGKEEIPWLVFLLRFSLPETSANRARFREIPNPLAITGDLDDARWTHIMVDEAQDLCVAQAAVLGSFVHPDGAFTVSADFNQVVSPVWGMENPEAFKIGISLRDKGVYQSFPFAKNMRQSRQIGLFLQSFYQSIFGKIAPFEVNDVVAGKKPLLFVGSSSEFGLRIHQRLNVLRRNPEIQSIALLQVNEDKEAMDQIRANLEMIGVELAPIWNASDATGRLITTSVERIKGLEYDACFVVGLDDDDNRNLNFAKNRAYVALSRPSLHLAMFCEEIPRSLQKIDHGLMDIFKI